MSKSSLRRAVKKSSLVTMMLLFVLLLLLYASLYPFSGWQSALISVSAMLLAPAPKYWVGSEVLANILAYMPLGVLAVWAFYPKAKSIGAWLLAVLLGIAFSISMESVQRYLPARVPSNIDVLANSFGTVLGATLGLASVTYVLGQNGIRRLKNTVFMAHSDNALLLGFFWLLALLYPQSLWFVTGNLVATLLIYFPALQSVTSRLPTLNGVYLYWGHIGAMSCAFIAATLLLTHCVAKIWMRYLVVILWGGLALFLQYSSHRWFHVSLLFPLETSWLYFAILLLVCGILICLPVYWQWIVAILALCVQLLCINILALFESHHFVQITWLNLSHLALGLTVSWPFVALIVLLGRNRFVR